MRRDVRVARGTAGAFVATLLAAISHAAAGGEITAFAVIATTVLALPVCVALAGRIASLWRLTVGVAFSQFLYHWCFASLGVAQSAAEPVVSAAPHARHMAQLESFVPSVAAAGVADALMWIAHSLAAVLTITILYRGERAVLALRNLLGRCVDQRVLGELRLGHAKPPVSLPRRNLPLRDLLRSQLAFFYRGPPAALTSALS